MLQLEDSTAPVAGVSCARTAAGQILTLSGSDDITVSPQIFVVDSVSGFEAGPFVNGDRVFLRIVPKQPPFQKPLAGYAARLQFRGPALVIAVDDAGNVSEPASCP